MLMVRDADNDEEVDNEEQETFVLPAAGPDNNIRYEKRSGIYKILKYHKDKSSCPTSYSLIAALALVSLDTTPSYCF